jgi:hypothetical protein
MAVGDLNGDTIPDLAVTYGEATANNIETYFGDGNDGFTRGERLYGGRAPAQIVFNDINEDGIADIVISNHDLRAEAANISALLGNGDGSFQPVQPLFRCGLYCTFAFADMDGDGLQDMVVQGQIRLNHQLGYTGIITVLLKNADGSFLPQQSLQADLDWNNGFFIGDVDGNGVLDLIIAESRWDEDDYHGIPSITTLLGEGDGSLQREQTLDLYAKPIAAGDINNDGTDDLILSNGRILFANGFGGFEAEPESQHSAFGSDPITLEDINGDGLLDLISNRRGIVVQLGNGDGTFRYAQHFVNNEVSSFLLDDLNGDSILDIIFASAYYTGDGQESLISSLLAHGEN